MSGIYEHFKFSSSQVKGSKISEINLNILSQYIWDVKILIGNQYKKLIVIFYILFGTMFKMQYIFYIYVIIQLGLATFQLFISHMSLVAAELGNSISK